MTYAGRPIIRRGHSFDVLMVDRVHRVQVVDLPPAGAAPALRTITAWRAPGETWNSNAEEELLYSRGRLMRVELDGQVATCRIRYRLKRKLVLEEVDPHRILD